MFVWPGAARGTTNNNCDHRATPHLLATLPPSGQCHSPLGLSVGLSTGKNIQHIPIDIGKVGHEQLVSITSTTSTNTSTSTTSTLTADVVRGGNCAFAILGTGNETNWYLINKSHTPSQAKHLASPIWYVTQASSQTFLASLMILTHTFCILRLVGTLAVPKLHFLIYVSPCWNRDSLIFILLLF